MTPPNAAHSASESAPDELAPCPDRPNCVCSQDPRPRHAIAPLATGPDPEAAFERLHQHLTASPNVRITRATSRFLQAEVTTRWLRFVDDLQCVLSPAERVIHIRSASRLGRSDLGTNRRRVEALRTWLEKAQENTTPIAADETPNQPSNTPSAAAQISPLMALSSLRWDY